MLQILYVDNNEDYRLKFARLLKSNGYAVDMVNGPINGLEFLSKNPYDIVISELEFEAFSGLRLLQSVKKISSHTKRVVLTKNDNPDFEIKALENDVDLYLLKSRGEKLAINSIGLLKTIIRQSNDQKGYIIKSSCNLEINHINHEVKVKDEIVHLTPIEFEILKLLIENKDKYLSRSEIIEKVWGGSNVKTTRIVDTHIKKIREKTKCFSIVTVRGYGYMWRD